MVAPPDLAQLVGRRVCVDIDGTKTPSRVIAVGTRGATLCSDGQMRTVVAGDVVHIDLPTGPLDAS